VLKQTWRWFGPVDKVSLADIRQAGAEGIVSALHHIAPGTVWDRASIRERKEQIEAGGLNWDVVESLPVSEAIRNGNAVRDAHISAWITSMENLAAEGIRVICYNFMPVLDWTRTDLAAEMPSGARAMAFDLADFASFDIHVLERADAASDYPVAVVEAAAKHAALFGPDDHARLTRNILAGLPGAMESWTLDSLRDCLSAYAGLGADGLRANLRYFLEAVVPVADQLDMRLCCHPDDPPWPLLGLPRVMSTEADYRWLIDTVPSPANGITLCTGSLGARADNDLPGMVARFGPHIHFFHLRNVRRHTDTVPCAFHEDEHLAGSTDMVAVVKAALAEQARRQVEGRADWQIPMRPDHGQDILDDHQRKAAPGYPAIGRLKGLAELRGVMAALSHRSAP
jgi:mannonate dehydratase